VGNDQLLGQAGLDDLEGGDNVDLLIGGASDGADDNVDGGLGADMILNHSEIITPLQSDDTQVNFLNSSNRFWSDYELKYIKDNVLVPLMERTGNNALLKVSTGDYLSLSRKSGSASYVPNLGNGTLQIFDNHVYNASAIMHGIAANFDSTQENSAFADFLTLSGWVQNPADTTGLTQAGDPNWYFKTNSAFVTTTASFDPYQDFAETFVVAFNPNYAQFPAFSKTTFMNNWLNSL
jgi:hypothetical protein